MILNQPLSEEQRKKSQIYYKLYNAVNGASYMCLGETVLILFAVRLHAPNTLIAVIGSMMYLGFLILPFGMLRAAKVGAARSQADFWVARNISALLVATTALIAMYSEILAWSILLLGSFMFYGCRAAGIVVATPLIGNITTNEDRAKLIAHSTGLFYFFGFIALVTVSILLRCFDGLGMLAGIIVAGAVMGVTASGFIRKIDETSDIQRSARKPIIPQLREALFDSTLTRQIWAGFMMNLSTIMLAPISVLTIKRGYGISDTNAILFSLAQFGSMIPATLATGWFSERFGPRKVIIGGYFLNLLICLFWIVAPSSALMHQSLPVRFLFILPFAMAGSGIISMANAMTHYFLMSVSKERQVASSMFINIITGAMAGLTGMILTGGLLKFGARFSGPDAPPETMFRYYFFFAGIFLLCGSFFVLRLVPVLNTFIQTHGMEQTRTIIRESMRRMH